MRTGDRILVTVRTYPELSKTYGETVCTAGLREDGTWVRLYPVPFRRLDEGEQYRLYDWITCPLTKHSGDARPESYRPTGEIERVDHVGTSNNWRERRELLLGRPRIHRSLDEIIHAAKNNVMSLAVFKPAQVIDFGWEATDRKWDPAKLDAVRGITAQPDLFGRSIVAPDLPDRRQSAIQLPLPHRGCQRTDESHALPREPNSLIMGSPIPTPPSGLIIMKTSIAENTVPRAMTARRILRSLWLVGVLAVSTLFPPPAFCQVPAETEARLRSIFEARDFDARSFQATWLPDGSAYTTLETPSGALQPELIGYDAASGNRTVLASLSHLTPAGRSEPLSIFTYQFAPGGTWALLQTDTDGFWMLEPATSTLKKVEAGPGNTISPEGGRILFSRDGDLHVHDLAAAQTTRLTHTTAQSVSNGRAAWSPDGNRIAFVQSDASGVRMRSMLVPTDPSYPELQQVRFARVGETITKLRVGVVDAEGREVRWISIPSPDRGLLSRAGELGRELRGIAGGAVQPVSGRTGLLHRQREHGRSEPDLPRVRSGLGHRQLSPERRSGVDPGGRLLPLPDREGRVASLLLVLARGAGGTPADPGTQRRHGTGTGR